MVATTLLVPELLLAAPSRSAEGGLAVAVRGESIVDVGDAGALRAGWPDAGVETLDGCLLMAGLVNAHQHGRGLSQIQLGYPDGHLETWIAARRGRGPLDPYPLTLLAAANMLANGVTTTVHANYTYGAGDYEAEARASLRAYDESGIRVTFCVGAMDRGLVVYPPHEACFLAGLPEDLRGWLDRPGAVAYAGDAGATVALMDRLLADYAGHSRIRLCYGPAGPQWVSDGLMRRLAADAERRDLGLHLHALESPAQAAIAAELYPDGVFAHLEGLGAMGPRTTVAHGVWVNDRDIEVLARTGATVVRNPGCNLRLGNGIAPLARYLAGGVRVAVGTDNAGLADDEDLLRELRLADLLAREPNWHRDPPPAAADLLAMATVNGAAAAGNEAETGTVEVGRRADLVAIDLARVRGPYLDPDMPPVDAMLARAAGRDVRLTMVDGRVVYRDGTLAGLDRGALEAAAAAAAGAARGPRDPADRSRAGRLVEHVAAHYREVTRPD